MKKCLVLIILLLVPIVSAETWTSQEDFNCDICCIENERFFVTTTISNEGNETLWLGNSKLIDKDGEEFAFYKKSDPNFRYGLLPGKSIKLHYLGRWPAPSTKNTLSYKHCIYVGTFGKWMCGEEYKEKTIAKSEDFKCYEDLECPIDEYCKIEKDCTASYCEIIPLAKECGRKVGSRWVPYECCSDQACEEYEYCIDHACEQVECIKCGYIQNHRCVKFECCDNVDCGSDQVCINNECKEVGCDYCEYAEGHECKKHECCKNTECAEDESCEWNTCQKIECEQGYIDEHTCIKYQCFRDEDCSKYTKCEEGFCKDLGCKENEIIKEHKCEEIKTPLGYVKEHKYVSYFSKEAYEDNRRSYNAIFAVVALLAIQLIYSIMKPVVKERKRRKSYILIKPKKKS